MYVILFYIFIFPFCGQGPLWFEKSQGADIENCKKYWWTNLLYINNFYPNDMGQEVCGKFWSVKGNLFSVRECRSYQIARKFCFYCHFLKPGNLTKKYIPFEFIIWFRGWRLIDNCCSIAVKVSSKIYVVSFIICLFDLGFCLSVMSQFTAGLSFSSYCRYFMSENPLIWADDYILWWRSDTKPAKYFDMIQSLMYICYLRVIQVSWPNTYKMVRISSWCQMKDSFTLSKHALFGLKSTKSEICR